MRHYEARSPALRVSTDRQTLENQIALLTEIARAEGGR